MRILKQKAALKRIIPILLSMSLITSLVTFASVGAKPQILGDSENKPILGASDSDVPIVGQSGEHPNPDTNSMQSLEITSPNFRAFGSAIIYWANNSAKINVGYDGLFLNGFKTRPGILDSAIENSLLSSSAETTLWISSINSLEVTLSGATFYDTGSFIQYGRIGANGTYAPYSESYSDDYTKRHTLSNKSGWGSNKYQTLTLDLSHLKNLQNEKPGVYILRFELHIAGLSQNLRFNVVVDPESIIPTIDFINGTGPGGRTDPQDIIVGFTENSLSSFRDYNQEWVIKKEDGTVVDKKSIIIDQVSDSAQVQKAKKEELQKELTALFKTLNQGNYEITLNGSATSSTKNGNYRIENTLTKPFTLTKDAPVLDPVTIFLEKRIANRGVIEYSEKGETYNDIKYMDLYEFSGAEEKDTALITHEELQTYGDKSGNALPAPGFYPGTNHYVLEVGPSVKTVENIFYQFNQAELLRTSDLSVIQTAELVDDFAGEVPPKFLDELETIAERIRSEGRDCRLWKFSVPIDAKPEQYTFRLNGKVSGTTLSPYVKTFSDFSPEHLDALLLADGNINFPMQSIHLSSANTLTSDSWSRASGTVAYFSLAQAGFTQASANGYQVSQVYIVDDVNSLPDNPDTVPTNLQGPQPKYVGALPLGDRNPDWAVSDFWSVTIDKEHAGGTVVFYYEPEDKGAIELKVPELIEFGSIKLGESEERYPLQDLTYSIDDTRISSSYWELTVNAEPFSKGANNENLFKGSMYYIDANGNRSDIIANNVMITNQHLAFPDSGSTHYTHTWSQTSSDKLIFSTPGEWVAAKDYQTRITWSIQYIP